MNTSRTLASGFTSGLIGAFGFLALIGGIPSAQAARLIDVTVVNRSTGERLTPYRHDGKLYIAGTPGERYAIELKGVGAGRVLTVLSVDGVNVLTGQTAAPLQSGYVVDGWQNFAVNGWRKSLNDVAQFVFTDLPDSYAARTGRPANVGVIGVAVFREKVVAMQPPPVVIAPQWSRRDEGAGEMPGRMVMKEAAGDAARAMPQSAPAPAPEARAEGDSANRADYAASPASPAKSLAEPEKRVRQLGTGHGEREYSPTRYVDFERNSDTPDEIVTIYYDSRANLIARGIIPAPRNPEPRPFPATAGFVPDPRG